MGRAPRPSGNAGVHAALRAAVLRMTDTDPEELDAEVAAAMAQVCKDCGDIGPGYCVGGLAAEGGFTAPAAIYPGRRYPAGTASGENHVVGRAGV